MVDENLAPHLILVNEIALFLISTTTGTTTAARTTTTARTTT
jgi:hypothetical protein